MSTNTNISINTNQTFLSTRSETIIGTTIVEEVPSEIIKNCKYHPLFNKLHRNSKVGLAKQDLKDRIYRGLIFQNHHCLREGDIIFE
jgi:hypothetical protein